MAGLIYGRANPEKNAVNLEQLLRKELGIAVPLQYEVITNTDPGSASKEILSNIGKALALQRLSANTLASVRFSVDVPRPLELQVDIWRRGISAMAGTFVYAIPLNKPISGTVVLEPSRKMFSNGQFEGDPATADRLNSNRELLKQAFKVAVTRAQDGNMNITIPLNVKIEPTDSGSLLLLHRLGFLGFLGFGTRSQIGQVLDFATQLEQAL